MVDQTPRTKAWLADLEAIITEIEIKKAPSPRVTRKRRRTLKPLWEDGRWFGKRAASSRVSPDPNESGELGSWPCGSASIFALPAARPRAASMFPFSKQQSRLSVREAPRGCHRNVPPGGSLGSPSPLQPL